MASLAIVRKHHLPHRKAKDAAQKVADDLRSRFDLQYRWRGDDIEFRRSGLHGVLHVGADEVRLDCELGFMLAVLKPAIEKEVHRELERRFGDSAAT